MMEKSVDRAIQLAELVVKIDEFWERKQMKTHHNYREDRVGFVDNGARDRERRHASQFDREHDEGQWTLHLAYLQTDHGKDFLNMFAEQNICSEYGIWTRDAWRVFRFSHYSVVGMLNGRIKTLANVQMDFTLSLGNWRLSLI